MKPELTANINYNQSNKLPFCNERLKALLPTILNNNNKTYTFTLKSRQTVIRQIGDFIKELTNLYNNEFDDRTRTFNKMNRSNNNIFNNMDEYTMYCLKGNNPLIFLQTTTFFTKYNNR